MLHQNTKYHNGSNINEKVVAKEPLSRQQIVSIRHWKRWTLTLWIPTTHICVENTFLASILPICYWLEFLDLVFFFKATNGIVCVSHAMLPERIVPTRVTRASASNAKCFRPKKCRSSTYQHSFYVRTSRTWNSQPLQLRFEHVTLNQFKSLLSSYYKYALTSRFDIEDPRT